MGTYLSKNEEQISQSLKEQYEVQAQPYLLHKRTQEICILHKITTNSDAQVNRITLIIQQYMQNKCQSITKLRTHYYVDNTGYCSDEQNFYLVFNGQNNYTLKEQFAKRRLYRIKFKDEEIEQIIETFLCGLRQYDHRFGRDYNNLSLDSLAIDKKSNRIYLKDPWLAVTHSNDHSDPLTSLLLNYPSPEKLKAAFVNKLQDYKQFLSNLFSIGVMALELNRLEFADSIYTRRKEVNFEQIRLRLKQFQSQRLRSGIQCLLHNDPNQRKKIFQIWGIQNREQHCLHPIKLNEQNKLESNSQNKFKFASTNPQQQQMRPASSQRPLNASANQQNSFITVQIPQLPAKGNSQPRPFQNPTPLPTMSQYNRRPNEFIPEIPTLVQSHGTPNIIFNKNVPPTSIYHQRLPSFNDYLKSQENKSSNFKFGNMNPAIYYPAPQTNTIINPPFTNQISTRPNFNNANQNQSFLNKISQSIRSESFQTHIQSPIKQREINSIIIDTMYENPINLQKNQIKLQRSQSIIERLHNIQHPQQKIFQQPRIPHKQQTTKDNKIHREREPVSNFSSNEPIMRDNRQETYSASNHEQSTPPRPISKAQHNSTIVQVRDQDTPDHSRSSFEQLQQMEYVVQQYETGSKYEGYKSKGMRNGKGKFYYQDGGFYEGQWKDNKMDGYGKLYYEGGKIAYEGYWKQDQFNGMGKVYNDNPIPLQESFDYTNFNYIEDYWEYYQGMLNHDTKQGRGKIKFTNKQMFQGDFQNDKIHGFGKFYAMDKKLIEGIWRDSKLIKIITNNIHLE